MSAFGGKADIACATTTAQGDVQNEHAAARSFVIDTDENVFKNTTGCGTQSGLGIVYKRTQITSDALQRCLIDCAAKRQE